MDTWTHHDPRELAEQIRQLRQFEKDLTKPNIRDGTLFTALFQRGFALLGLVPSDVRQGIGANRNAVSRWLHGRGAPYPTSRPLVYNWLRQRAYTKRRQLERLLKRQVGDHAGDLTHVPPAVEERPTVTH